MSLRSISLRDFVIVKELDLDLSGGFTVLTGETGAGKSILIDALQLALGGRADAGFVREGTMRCEISAEFECPSGMSRWLEEAGLEAGPFLLVRRTIDQQGKSRSWINGSAATLAQLKEAGNQLVDIHGQHAWQSLTRPDSVRYLLDSYAGVSTEHLSNTWQRWRVAEKSLSDARASQASLLQERERLVWQLGELEKLAPGSTEWAELNSQHRRLSNAQALRDTVQTAVETLQNSEESACTLLSRAISLLENQEQIEPEFKNFVLLLREALAGAEDVVHSLQGYARHSELEPQQLAGLDERLALWISLSRRYKRGPAELPELLALWRQDLKKLDEASDLDQLQSEEAETRLAYTDEAGSVSRARFKAAPRLAKSITHAMQELGMRGGKFEVTLNTLDKSAQYGLEQAEFQVAGHSGSTPRPIGKVASGGELSRIALAIAVTTSQLGQAQTLIFDEVDAGVGGAVADTVGRLMKKLGQDRQVMAVTHLPQVAACADHHLVVAKRSGKESTTSHVEIVSGDQRIAELARMLGGERLPSTTLAHAKAMLES